MLLNVEWGKFSEEEMQTKPKTIRKEKSLWEVILVWSQAVGVYAGQEMCSELHCSGAASGAQMRGAEGHEEGQGRANLAPPHPAPADSRCHRESSDLHRHKPLDWNIEGMGCGIRHWDIMSSIESIC